MKSDLAVFEIKQLLKRFEKQNRAKTIVMVVCGIAFMISLIMLIIYKVNKKSEPVSYDGLDFEDWDDLDDMDYDDYDYDDYNYDGVDYTDEEVEE